MTRYLKSRSVEVIDILFVVVFLVLVAQMVFFQPWTNASVSSDDCVDQAYSAKSADDGTMYILDKSHERLIQVNADGNIINQITGKNIDNEFMYIDGFAVDEDGGIFIQGSEWDGMHLCQEYVYQLDSSGNLIKTIYQEDYEGNSVNKHRIYGMNVENGILTYYYAYDNYLLKNTYKLEGGIYKKEKIPYNDAFNCVSDIDVSDSGEYVLDKTGIIYDISDLKATKIWNVADSGIKNCVPYRMTASNDGRFLVTDIRGRSVVEINNKGDRLTAKKVWEDTDSLTISLCDKDSTDAFILTEFDSVKTIKDGTVVKTIAELTLNSHDYLIKVVNLLSIIVLILISPIVIIRTRYLLKDIKIATMYKAEIGIIIMLVVVSSILIFFLMNAYKESFTQKNYEQLESVAYSISSHIDSADVDAINEPKDFVGKAYKNISTVMEKTFTENLDLYSKLYCNILRLDKDGGYSIAYLDKSISTYYPLDELETSELKEVYKTGKTVYNGGMSDVSGAYLYVKVPVLDKDNNVRGAVAVGMDYYQVQQNLRDILRSIIVKIIIVIMIMALLVGEIISYVNSKHQFQEETQQRKKLAFAGHDFRLIVFAVFLVFNMSSAFLPVYILKHSANVNIISRSLTISLPLTINLLALGIMSLAVAGMVRKMGVFKVSVISVILAMTGNLMIFFFPSYYMILLGLVLDGIGVGIISNALYIIVAGYDNEEDQRRGFSVYNAASVSGINLGMMTGAFIAEFSNQRTVFFIIGIMWIAVLGLSLFVFKNFPDMKETASEDEKNGKKKNKIDSSIIGIGEFLKDKAVLSFYILIQNPYIIFNSFAFFLVPIFCDNMGYGETVTSLLLMLYSVISLYLSEKITEGISKSIGNRAMYLAYFMNIVAVIIYAWAANIVGLIAALVILGFSASFGKSVQQMYYMDLPGVKKYGEDNAIGVYNFTENIGESLGPIIFSYLMAAEAMALAVSGFSAVIAALGAVHMLINRDTKNK